MILENGFVARSVQYLTRLFKIYAEAEWRASKIKTPYYTLQDIGSTFMKGFHIFSKILTYDHSLKQLCEP